MEKRKNSLAEWWRRAIRSSGSCQLRSPPLHYAAMISEKRGPAFETPMMRQYLTIKEKHPRDILFFRMGDFYEMFLDDAKEASELLGLTLTSRSKDKNSIPMAGIPVRALDTYLPKLLRAGKRVAICEQTEDPKAAKGLVDRDVVRVISPGTVTDEKLVGEKSNNYIASLVFARRGFGLAWLDVTTGQFSVWEATQLSAISTEISRIDPAELLGFPHRDRPHRHPAAIRDERRALRGLPVGGRQAARHARSSQRGPEGE